MISPTDLQQRKLKPEFAHYVSLLISKQQIQAKDLPESKKKKEKLTLKKQNEKHRQNLIKAKILFDESQIKDLYFDEDSDDKKEKVYLYFILDLKKMVLSKDEKKELKKFREKLGFSKKLIEKVNTNIIFSNEKEIKNKEDFLYELLALNQINLGEMLFPFLDRHLEKISFENRFGKKEYLTVIKQNSIEDTLKQVSTKFYPFVIKYIFQFFEWKDFKLIIKNNHEQILDFFSELKSEKEDKKYKQFFGNINNYAFELYENAKIQNGKCPINFSPYAKINSKYKNSEKCMFENWSILKDSSKNLSQRILKLQSGLKEFINLEKFFNKFENQKNYKELKGQKKIKNQDKNNFLYKIEYSLKQMLKKEKIKSEKLMLLFWIFFYLKETKEKINFSEIFKNLSQKFTKKNLDNNFVETMIILILLRKRFEKNELEKKKN